MTKGAATREWPAWSLPPPENKNKENAVDNGIKDDNCESTCTVDLPTESGFFSGEDTSHDNKNEFSSNAKSLLPENSSPCRLVPETENETSRSEFAAKTEEGEETFLATVPHADSSQQSDEITTPSRPRTPEAPRSSRNPLVTGHRSCQNNPEAGALHPLSNDGRHIESGNPAEHYDNTENNGLLTELQKVFITNN